MKKSAVILLLILMPALFAYAAVQTVDYLTNSSSCLQCHTSPHQPILKASIAKHNISCAECHVKKGMKSAEAINVLMQKEILYALKPSIENFSRMNSSYRINQMSLQAACIECHGVGAYSSSTIPVGPHKNWSCDTCHLEDMQPVQCTTCHTPHKEKVNWTYSECLQCHENPHIPVKSSKNFGSISNELCASCHDEQYKKLEKEGGKHFNNYCSLCHPAHRTAKRCIDCHFGHVNFHRPYGDCSSCHGENVWKAKCKDCHNPHAPKENLSKPTSTSEFTEYARKMIAKRLGIS